MSWDTQQGMADRICPQCRTYTQHIIVVPRREWKCIGCGHVSDMAPRERMIADAKRYRLNTRHIENETQDAAKKEQR